MDFIVNLPWSEGSNAVLVVVDKFTKHANFIPTDTGLDAKGFANLFVKHIVSKYGLPENIICDRDPRWASDFWREVARLLGSSMLMSSSHHPQHDGQTEILNRHLATLLRAYIGKDKTSWAEWLHVVEFAYNSSLHSSTGYTPFYLLRGFEPRAPSDFLLLSQQGKDERSHDAKEFTDNLKMHRDDARLALAKAQDEQTKYFNKGRRPVPNLKPGSRALVNPHSLEWVESKGGGKKLTERWIGPFEVMQQINPNTYRLRMGDNYKGFPVFNFDHLKPYTESDTDFGERTLVPDSELRGLASEEYDLESIIGHRRKGKSKSLEYLVRWEGYGPQFDMWRTPLDLKNAPDLMREYNAANGL